MSVPRCPSGCQLLQATCYCQCPLNSEPANEDPTKCVDIKPCSVYVIEADPQTPYPGALISDPTFSLTCTKRGYAVPMSSALGAPQCATNFTQWQTGTCYINCPPGLLENGLSCLKRPLARPYQAPVCPWYYTFDGTTCSINYMYAIFVFILLAIFYKILFLK